jgi:P2 family phage contractile tail tube protein
MANQTPDTNITYEAYLDGTRFIGTTEITLPNLQPMTAEVKGAGVSGAIDKPVRGMMQASSMSIAWRTVEPGAVALMQAKQHHLEFWAAVQVTDPGSGEFLVKQHKITVRGEFKGVTPGKFAVAEAQGRTMDLGVVYYKEEYDGEEQVEFDQYNQKYVVKGNDELAAVRQAVGL